MYLDGVNAWGVHHVVGDFVVPLLASSAAGFLEIYLGLHEWLSGIPRALP
jgi:hypothetical protein